MNVDEVLLALLGSDNDSISSFNSDAVRPATEDLLVPQELSEDLVSLQLWLDSHLARFDRCLAN